MWKKESQDWNFSFMGRRCQGTNAGDEGTCFTAEECGEKGGTSIGRFHSLLATKTKRFSTSVFLSPANCASGFGVCCQFTTSTCGSDVKENCTFVQNPNFPASFMQAANCQYNVQNQNSSMRTKLHFPLSSNLTKFSFGSYLSVETGLPHFHDG